MKTIKITFDYEIGANNFKPIEGELINLDERNTHKKQINSKYKFAVIPADGGYLVANVETGQKLSNEPKKSKNKAIDEALFRIMIHPEHVDYYIESNLKHQNRK